jgi:hypothetical protein
LRRFAALPFSVFDKIVSHGPLQFKSEDSLYNFVNDSPFPSWDPSDLDFFAELNSDTLDGLGALMWLIFVLG